MKRDQVYFNPDGNDLKRIFYYYGIEIDDQILCPFHDDNNPSCHVNFEEGIYHCFACGASGDAFQFVKSANPKIDDLSQLLLYFEILKSKKVKGLKLSKLNKAKNKKKVIDKENKLDVAHDFYYGLKSVNWKKENSAEKRYMKSRGFTSQMLNACGAKLTYIDNYPIIFPLMDMNTFKGYIIRTLDKKIEKKKKYLYNEGFSRNDTLAGKYNNEVVVLTEGFIDSLKLRQFGLEYVAAILGWKITSKQVEKLKARGVKTIISALDTDKPGRQGTDYLKNFFHVIEFQFPKGVKDPGDLTEKQFRIAYAKTKELYRKERRNKQYVNSKQYQKGRSK